METRFKVLGTATTIGELKKIIAEYPDETPFGFRNQPIQQLIEDKINGQTFVSFDEIETSSSEKTWTNEKIANWLKDVDLLWDEGNEEEESEGRKQLRYLINELKS